MNDRRVILIKGDGSKWYDEVIFIVKSGAEVPTSPVLEAERIVRNYIASKYSNNIVNKDTVNISKKVDNKLKKVDKIGKRKVKNGKIDKAIDVCLILIMIALAVLVFFVVN